MTALRDASVEARAVRLERLFLQYSTVNIVRPHSLQRNPGECLGDVGAAQLARRRYRGHLLGRLGLAVLLAAMRVRIKLNGSDVGKALVIRDDWALPAQDDYEPRNEPRYELSVRNAVYEGCTS